jgi:hypothetical protein
MPYNESGCSGKTLIKVEPNELLKLAKWVFKINWSTKRQLIQALKIKTLACGIPQAWYGAGLLSLWSKGRVGSIPTSRAISHICYLAGNVVDTISGTEK